MGFSAGNHFPLSRSGSCSSPLDVPEPRSPQNAASWYALYTRSRHEKFVDLELRKKGVHTFLPFEAGLNDQSVHPPLESLFESDPD